MSAHEGTIFYAMPGDTVWSFAAEVADRRENAFGRYEEVWAVFNGRAVEVRDGMTADDLERRFMA